ncbi:MAG: Tryptophan synthase alpha chain, partial [uncultured Cytophagales bacterium]
AQPHQRTFCPERAGIAQRLFYRRLPGAARYGAGAAGPRSGRRRPGGDRDAVLRPGGRRPHHPAEQRPGPAQRHDAQAVVRTTGRHTPDGEAADPADGLPQPGGAVRGEKLRRQ